jgi:hypothetical protein
MPVDPVGATSAVTDVIAKAAAWELSLRVELFVAVQLCVMSRAGSASRLCGINQ